MEPLLFIKPSAAVIALGEPIVTPAASRRVDREAELAVVIRKKARKVLISKVQDFILGYACINDVTARDIQQRGRTVGRAKDCDAFGLLGAVIETGLDPGNLKIECFVK